MMDYVKLLFGIFKLTVFQIGFLIKANSKSTMLDQRGRLLEGTFANLNTSTVP